MKKTVNFDGETRIIPPYAIAVREFSIELIEGLVEYLADKLGSEYNCDAVKFELGVVVFACLNTLNHRHKVDYEYGCTVLVALMDELFDRYAAALPAKVGEPFDYISKKLQKYEDNGCFDIQDIINNYLYINIDGAVHANKVMMEYPFLLKGFTEYCDTKIVIATLTDYSIGNMFIPLVDVVFANCDYDSSEDFVKYCVDEYNNVSK